MLNIIKRYASRVVILVPLVVAACAAPIQFLEKDIEGRYFDAYERPSGFFTQLSDQEKIVGLASVRSEGFGIAPAREINSYLNEVMARLVAAGPVPNASVRAILTANPSPGVVVTGSGLVLVSAGMLLAEEVENEDQLAAMLAHELAHILYQHQETDIYENITQRATQASNLFDNFRSLVSKSEFSNSTTTNYLLGASELTENIIAPNLFTKGQEDDADRLGVDIMVAAGYNLDSVFDTLRFAQARQTRSREANSDKREKEIAQAADQVKSGLNEGDAPGVVEATVNTARKAVGSVKGALFERFGSGYYDPEVRETRLRDYISREHRFVERPVTRDLPWMKQPDGAMATMLNNYRAVREALDAQQGGDLDEAVARIKVAVSWPTETDAYPRWAFSKIREDQGLREQYLQNLTIATRSEEPALKVYLELIGDELAQGRIVEAGKLLDSAAVAVGNPPHLLPARIRYQKLLGNDLEARGLVLNCKATYPKLAAKCEKEFNDAATVARDGAATDALNIKSVQSLEDQIDTPTQEQLSR